jgi:hypothetical protein
MTKKSKLLTLFITIFILILSISNHKVSGGRYLKTNINTHIDTVAEVYNYTLMINSSISQSNDVESISIENLNNELLIKSRSYKSKYSVFAYKDTVSIIKKNLVLLGEFEFSFNENIHLIDIKNEKDTSNNKKIFMCKIKVFLVDKYLFNKLPDCNYQNMLNFNKDFNNKVKENIILSYLYNIAFAESNFFSKDTDLLYIYNKLNSYKFSKFYPNFSYKVIHMKEKNSKTDKSFSDTKNSILVVAVKFRLDPVIDFYETCKARFFYPNTELTPNFLHGEIISCK